MSEENNSGLVCFFCENYHSYTRPKVIEKGICLKHGLREVLGNQSCKDFR